MAASAEKEKVSFCQKLGNQFRSLGTFLYSKRTVNGIEQALVMGRNANSWAKIGLFYICFYSFLAGFFAAMLSVFLTSIAKPGFGPPKLTQYIANKPGLTIVNDVYSGYDTKDNSTMESFRSAVNTFLDGYQHKDYSKVECNPANKTGYEGQTPCKFNVKQALGENCTDANYYGLKDKKPCILVKMNKVYGWVPEGDSEYLTLTCSGDGEPKVVNKGYLKAAMPFRGQPFYTNPIAVVQVEVQDSAVEVRCKLEGDKIEVSDSYNPKRAFGKVEFSVAAPKST